jgi:hypothetical protein
MGRTIRGRWHPQVTIVNDPDAFALQAQSLGIATLSQSPMSMGTGDRGYIGDRGYGLNGNQFTGDTLPHLPIQAPAQPVLTPSQTNVGIGAMVSGQPGLPNSGSETPASALSWMSSIPHGMGS